MLVSFLVLVAASNLDTHSLEIPQQYQAETTVVVKTSDTQDEINYYCGKAPKGYVTMACERRDLKILIVPNPCLVKEASDPDSYAHLLCHEIGHTEGWDHDHE